MRIILADDRNTYTAGQMAGKPLGGAEAAFLNLARALHGKGHTVTPLTPEAGWWHEMPRQPLKEATAEPCDIFIASRSTRLLRLSCHARRRFLWLHNPAGYLRKPRNLLALARYRPVLITTSAYHRRTLPWLVRGLEGVTLPLGLDEAYRQTLARSDAPSPIALFTAQPQRGLEWLINLWQAAIHPRCPNAQLWAYTGYQQDAANQAVMARLRTQTGALERAGIFIKAPLPPAELANVLRHARVMLYPSDAGETFCLAAAEAQACGVPLVTRPLGCLPERLVPEKTGFIRHDPAAFAAAAVQLLQDDALWQSQYLASLAQPHLGWAEVAERLLTLAA